MKVLIGLAIVGIAFYNFVGTYLKARWFMNKPLARFIRDTFGEGVLIVYSYMISGLCLYIGLAIIFGFEW